MSVFWLYHNTLFKERWQGFMKEVRREVPVSMNEEFYLAETVGQVHLG